MHEEMINPHVLFTSQGRWLLPVKELEGLERQISALGGIDVIAERGVRALAAAGIARIREDGLARRGGAAIIPIRGVIMPEPNCASSWNGWTTCQELVESVATAMADDSVREIVLDVDSPGGYITGVQEAAAYIAACRGRKRVTAHIGGLCTSAAYWIASAAERIMICKTGEAGSVGVAVVMTTEGDEKTKLFVSSQSPNKRPDFESDEGAALIQQEIDQLADIFIDDVANYRGVDRESVISDFGHGWIKIGAEAVSAGLVDAVGTFEDLMASIEEQENYTGGNHNMATEDKQAVIQPQITAESVKADYPDVFAAIAAIGAMEERKRITDIQALSFPGMEKLTASLINDGADVGTASVVIIKEQKRLMPDALAARQADAAPAAQVIPGSTPHDDKAALAAAEMKIEAELARASAREAGEGKKED